MPYRRTSLWKFSYVWMLIPFFWATASYGFVAGKVNDLPVIGDTSLVKNRHVALGMPEVIAEDSVIISRNQYVVNWNIWRHVPNWVGWSLDKKALGNVPRTNTFRLDHDLKEYLKAFNETGVSPDDYRGSCLDRGHQVPSADRTATLAANQATFFMTNMMPQAAFLNRILWASFERFLRQLVLEQGKEISIYSGAVFIGSGRIGPNDEIQVPTRNFKIAVIKPANRRSVPRNQMRLLVVDFPNLTSKKTDPLKDIKQACLDSERTVRLDENNRTPYWRPFIRPLDKVELDSGMDLEFLKDIPVISKSELDTLIGPLPKTTQPFASLPQILRSAIETVQ